MVSDKRKMGIGIGLALTLIGALAIAYEAGDSGSANASVKGQQGYFSADDGKTWFKADADTVTPFDYKGQQAVEAHVYECGGEKFVAYLERYRADAHKVMAAVKDASDHNKPGPPPVNLRAIQQAGSNGHEVKRPGDKEWVPLHSTAGVKVVAVKCPGGKAGEPTPVEP